MSKGLEALKSNKLTLNEMFDNDYTLDDCLVKVFVNNNKVIEKELKDGENYKAMYRLEHEKNQQLSQANLKMSKVLEIIKEKQVDMTTLSVSFQLTSLDYYNEDIMCVNHKLTQEEWNLLREVLL